MPITEHLKNKVRRGRVSRLLRRFIGDRHGVAAIEFVMLALPFFLLVFAILETCLSFAAQQVLSNAMDDVAREIRTGKDWTKTITDLKLKEAICDHFEIISINCLTSNNLAVDLQSYDTFQLAAADDFVVRDGIIYIKRGAVLLLPSVSPGSAGDIHTLRVFYKWPVITDIMRPYLANVDSNKTLLFATITWKNEPFDD